MLVSCVVSLLATYSFARLFVVFKVIHLNSLMKLVFYNCKCKCINFVKKSERKLKVFQKLEVRHQPQMATVPSSYAFDPDMDIC